MLLFAKDEIDIIKPKIKSKLFIKHCIKLDIYKYKNNKRIYQIFMQNKNKKNIVFYLVD
jgi:hypothetical protein